MKKPKRNRSNYQIKKEQIIKRAKLQSMGHNLKNKVNNLLNEFENNEKMDNMILNQQINPNPHSVDLPIIIPKINPNLEKEKLEKEKNNLYSNLLSKENSKNRNINKNNLNLQNIEKNLKTMKKKIKKLQKSPFMTGVGLTKVKKPTIELKPKSREKDEMMDNIDSYTNEVHEEFDEIKYLIKFADNTHKLIDRHKNVMTNIFRGAGLRPSKKLEEEEKLASEKGKIKKHKSAGKFNMEELSNYNYNENEYDDQPYYKNGYYYRNAREDDMDFGGVFDKLKAINKVKDNLSNIQDDFLGYHENLRTKMRRINGGK